MQLECHIDEGDGMPSANIRSLRDRRRAELISEIQNTAHQLFAERGFAAVTTEDIAAAAGISISTYFRYAPTRKTCLSHPSGKRSPKSLRPTAPSRPMHQQPKL